jgi:hypothetical protein
VASDLIARKLAVSAAWLYFGGMIGCIVAYSIFLGELCKPLVAQIGNVSLTMSYVGAATVAVRAIIVRSMGAWSALGGGLLVCAAMYLAMSGLGAACSGI